jgi:hypothetical protein
VPRKDSAPPEFRRALSVTGSTNRQEVDYYWLKDMLMDKDTAKASRVMEAMLKMVKFDIAALRKAYVG